jgi:asparagine synthase (glutamine-hydrolysing)
VCGIAGFWGPPTEEGEAARILGRMTDAIRHRGPDDSGQWLDTKSGIALGHRRLSILDLSPEGHQPMVSASGRFVIIYNGEIYNFAELRREEEARGVRFRGHSDTEIMLAVIERHGVLEATRRFAGMFAFALWDQTERVLHLVRDRIGEKPLYYGWIGETLLFGSELKGLKVHPQWRSAIDRDALALYLRYNYVPAPYSIYSGIRKVEPATLVSIGADRQVTATAYWDMADVVRRGLADPLGGPEEAILDQLETRLRQTIAEEMLADVPLGAFLSGGIDSSTIVALMQAQSPRPVRTFTIGFREAGYNEAEHAKAVARHLGTDHTELYVTPEEARAVIPRLPAIYDEPFGDSSQIPTFLVSQLARQHVTVALSGDGGDEMFGGYTRYFMGRRIWNGLAPVPAWIRRSVARGIQAVPPGAWGSMLGTAQRLLPARARVAHPGDRMHKLANVMAVPSAGAMYRSLVSNWDPPAEILRGSREVATVLTADHNLPRDAGFVERMMYLDTRTYLPDDIMVKVDRASMAVSLESRAPFLDHRVVELAWRLPMHLKLRDGQGKWALRALLDRHVPRALVERPKMGFGVPIDSWLRGPLKGWAEALLDPARLQMEGFFDAGAVRQKWDEHQSGRQNRQYPLWNLLMFQAWLESR